MGEQDWLAERFEENRSHLKAVAYRMLGSASEAEDAIQETWLRLSRSDSSEIENLRGWLTTVVSRVCLDMLRSRTSRREDALDEGEVVEKKQAARNPEQEAVLADSVGLALMVVLNRLSPAERIAFVLHDLFAVSFEEISSIMGRTTAAVRQLASRARRRMSGVGATEETGLSEQRELVEAFLAALRAGDLEGLIAVLDPDVVVHLPEGAREGARKEIRGAENWARGAITFSHLAKFTSAMVVDGSVGLVFAPNGQLQRVMKIRFAGGKIAEVEFVVDPKKLSEMEVSLL